MSNEEIIKEYELPCSDAIEGNVNTYSEENISDLVECGEDEQDRNGIHRFSLLNLMTRSKEKLSEERNPE